MRMGDPNTTVEILKANYGRQARLPVMLARWGPGIPRCVDDSDPGDRPESPNHNHYQAQETSMQ